MIQKNNVFLVNINFFGHHEHIPVLKQEADHDFFLVNIRNYGHYGHMLFGQHKKLWTS